MKLSELQQKIDRRAELKESSGDTYEAFTAGCKKPEKYFGGW